MTTTRNSVYSFDRPLVLVGMPGCGKTTVGTRLAKALYLPFVDSDAEIVSREGMSIANIFKQKGEPYFRDVEAQVIRDLSARGAVVMSIGGGGLVRDETRKFLKDSALLVWLDIGVAALLARLEGKRGRPLLEVDNREEVLQELLQKRLPYFEQAHIKVDAAVGTRDDVVERIQLALAEYNAKVNA